MDDHLLKPLVSSELGLKFIDLVIAQIIELKYIKIDLVEATQFAVKTGSSRAAWVAEEVTSNKCICTPVLLNPLLVEL